MSPLTSSASPRDTRSETVRTAALIRFSLETSVTSVMVIPLSIALAMSYTVSAATATAVSASISTPVFAVTSAEATMSTRPSPTSSSTATWSSGSGWQRGMRRLVSFAPMIPASFAVVSASPLGRSRSRRAVSGAISTAPRATARRRTGGLAPTSTIFTVPEASSTCESSLATSPVYAERGGARVWRRA